MELIILKQAQRELKDAPKDIIQDVFALFDDLMNGKNLSMPISRPLPSIAKGLHELRLSGRAGEFRIFMSSVWVMLSTYCMPHRRKLKKQIDAQQI